MKACVHTRLCLTKPHCGKPLAPVKELHVSILQTCTSPSCEEASEHQLS